MSTPDRRGRRIAELDIKIIAGGKTVEEQPFPDGAADQLKSNNVSQSGSSELTNFRH
jgi:hypothetical protein